jgi:hypothetical protein
MPRISFTVLYDISRTSAIAIKDSPAKDKSAYFKSVAIALTSVSGSTVTNDLTLLST